MAWCPHAFWRPHVYLERTLVTNLWSNLFCLWLPICMQGDIWHTLTMTRNLLIIVREKSSSSWSGSLWCSPIGLVNALGLVKADAVNSGKIEYCYGHICAAFVDRSRVWYCIWDSPIEFSANIHLTLTYGNWGDVTVLMVKPCQH